jgi:hypothetical protein
MAVSCQLSASICPVLVGLAVGGRNYLLRNQSLLSDLLTESSHGKVVRSRLKTSQLASLSCSYALLLDHTMVSTLLALKTSNEPPRPPTSSNLHKLQAPRKERQDYLRRPQQNQLSSCSHNQFSTLTQRIASSIQKECSAAQNAIPYFVRPSALLNGIS